MNDTLLVNEIFYSIQGEGTHIGAPCAFVRLTGCHLRCCYYVTEYAFHEGRRQSIDAVIKQLCSNPCELIEITGAEPLLQPNVHKLMRRLCNAGRTVLVETSTAVDISGCDRNLWTNLDHLTLRDEIKFVICNRNDYE